MAATPVRVERKMSSKANAAQTAAAPRPAMAPSSHVGADGLRTSPRMIITTAA